MNANSEGPTTSGAGESGELYGADSLMARLSERLLGTDFFDASQMRLIVEDGAVTLRGKVPTAYAKETASEILAGVEGVTSWHNELEVAQETGVPLTR